MQQIKIFYSWQSELNDVTEEIESVLKECADSISSRYKVDTKVLRATTESRGAININNAVEQGIRNSDIFVGDLTPIQTYNGRCNPNANVIMEYGQAIGCNGKENIVVVAKQNGFNPKDLPFDFSHDIIVIYSSISELQNMLMEELDKIISKIIHPAIYEHSAVFFNRRISGSFPEVRGLQWYTDPFEIKLHLDEFFKDPISFGSADAEDAQSDPIWWFRCGQSESIEAYRHHSNGVYMFGSDDGCWTEFKIKQIAVYVNPARYYMQYIYVETEPLPPIFPDEYTEPRINQNMEDLGFCEEEYAVIRMGDITRNIRRIEFDSGSFISDGEIVRIKGRVELRSRFLTPFNFVIAAKQSSINCNQFDRISSEYMPYLLKNQVGFTEFHNEILKLDKPEW